jgi:hypothetical protein
MLARYRRGLLVPGASQVWNLERLDGTGVDHLGSKPKRRYMIGGVYRMLKASLSNCCLCVLRFAGKPVVM